jgi:hypothetical protein
MLDRTTSLVRWYVAVVVATVAALAVMSALGSRQATSDAWVHAVVVGVFALVMPRRLRAARRGGTRALRAVGIIAAVLLTVNLVEAAIPHMFPAWMRIEMVGIAALMAAVLASVVRAGHDGAVGRDGVGARQRRPDERTSG